MVRKWSYLNKSGIGVVDDSLINPVSLYQFKVFRKTTRFKKFNRGITKMVRKKYARRKHRTNWLVLSHVSKFWALSYLKMRQFERFFSSLSQTGFRAFSADVNVFMMKISEVFNRSGLNISSCTSTQLNRYVSKSKSMPHLLNPTQNTNNAVVRSSNLSTLFDSHEVFPNLLQTEGLTYYLNGTNIESILKTITVGQLFKPSVSILTSLRSTSILLTLYNSRRV